MIWPFPIAAVLVAAALALLGVGWRKSFHPLFCALFGFAILGLVVGMLSGLSRESVMGAVMPAVLSFVGGGAAFMMKNGPIARKTVGLCVVAFSFSILIGTNWGSTTRFYFEHWQKSVEQRKSEVAARLELERYENRLREWYELGDQLSDNQLSSQN
ncbi:MAG: hypothetical protein ACFB13_06760 [Kiloniellaceae bacterium]